MKLLASDRMDVDYDTLDDLPQPINFEFLRELLFGKLRECVGWTVKGHVYPEYGTGAYWGRGMKLESGEIFYLRAYPKGVIGASAAMFLPQTCFVATRPSYPP